MADVKYSEKCPQLKVDRNLDLRSSIVQAPEYKNATSPPAGLHRTNYDCQGRFLGVRGASFGL